MSSGSWKWLPHKELIWVPAESTGPGTYKTYYGEEVQSDTDPKDLEPVASDDCLSGKIGDLISMPEFGEGAILHSIRERYKRYDIHTNIGSILIAVNPYKRLPFFGSESIMEYDNHNVNEMPPHIYAIAKAAYRDMLDEHKNQAIIISGESGAGKTESTKNCLQYLSEVAGSEDGVEKLILQSNPILEAFGNAKTVRNNNSSRFGKWMEVHFEKHGKITSSHISEFLLEKSRVTAVADGERNYHAFYFLLMGENRPERRKFLRLEDPKNFYYLTQSPVMTIEHVDDGKEWEITVEAMLDLGFEEDEVANVEQILAAVLWLGNFKFKPKGHGSEIENTEALDHVAKLLEVEAPALVNEICFHRIGVRGRKSFAMAPMDCVSAAQSRDALAKALFAEMFHWLVRLVNKKLRGSNDVLAVGVLDISGFEIFAHNMFEQFCINYVNEKLQQHFNTHVFKMEQDEYKKENIDFSEIVFSDNRACLALIEQKRPPGILALMTEQVIAPNGSDEGFITMCHQQFAENKKTKHPNYLKNRRNPQVFIIRHYAGDVEYDSVGMIGRNEDKLYETTKLLLHCSKNILISELFPYDEKHNHQTKKSTLCKQIYSQLSDLMGTLARSEPHYVRCIKPNTERSSSLFYAEMVLLQMKYSGLFEAIRIHRDGYPSRRPYKEFVDLYTCMLGKEALAASQALTDYREKTIVMVESMPFMLKGSFQFGKTKLFLKTEPRLALSRARDEAVSKCAIKVQAFVRYVTCQREIQRRKGLLDLCKKALPLKDGDALSAALYACSNGSRPVIFPIHTQIKEKMKWIVEEVSIGQRLRSSGSGNDGSLARSADEDKEDIADIVAALTEHKNFSSKYKLFINQTSPELNETVLKTRKRLEAIKNALNGRENCRKHLKEGCDAKDVELLEAALDEALKVNLPQHESHDASILLSELNQLEENKRKKERALMRKQSEALAAKKKAEEEELRRREMEEARKKLEEERRLLQERQRHEEELRKSQMEAIRQAELERLKMQKEKEKKVLPPCPYGAECTLHDLHHRENYEHYNPICPFGLQCKLKDEYHVKNYKHLEKHEMEEPPAPEKTRTHRHRRHHRRHHHRHRHTTMSKGHSSSRSRRQTSSHDSGEDSEKERLREERMRKVIAEHRRTRAIDNRPKCKYGVKCRQRGPEHRQRYSHGIPRKGQKDVAWVLNDRFGLSNDQTKFLNMPL